jgi:glycosyltransferase involved in cell wall biosynthesis
MEKVALIASRKFNPGHYSHILAIYKLLNEAGWRAIMYLHPSFRPMSSIPSDRIVTTLHQACRVRKLSALIVCFPSMRALADMALARLFRRAKIVYLLHEPFESFSSYLNAGFGLRKTLRICLVSMVNYGLVLLSHKIIVSSQRAEGVFRIRYSAIRKDYGLIPLLYDDESDGYNLGQDRRYISYIGTVAEDHAFDAFLKFVRFSIESELFPGYRYLIATGSSLTASDNGLIAPLLHSGRLVVREGTALSDSEINECFCASLVVWNAYRRSMQSGVLAKSYMFGTPLIVAVANSSEFFVDRQNGVLVRNAFDPDEIGRAISNVVDNFAAYSASCRRKFLDTFYYKAQAEAFARIVADAGTE